MKSEPLTDAEFERLSGILARFDNKQPMNLEQLDGFLAALICGPEIVSPSEYLPVIFGSDMVLDDSFGSQSVLQDFLSLIMRHWNVIADTLHSGDVFLPLLLLHNSATGNLRRVLKRCRHTEAVELSPDCTPTRIVSRSDIKE